MARKTDGEKIDELEKLVATLVERGDTSRKELAAVRDEITELAKSVADLKTGVAVRLRDLTELQRTQVDVKKEQEETSKKH